MARRTLEDGATVETGYVFDPEHQRLAVGTEVVAPFNGAPGRFRIVGDTGTGMLRVRRPDGSESPMRPRTILAVATEVIPPAPNTREGMRRLRDKIRTDLRGATPDARMVLGAARYLDELVSVATNGRYALTLFNVETGKQEAYGDALDALA